MRTAQIFWKNQLPSLSELKELQDINPQIVMAFGPVERIHNQDFSALTRAAFPQAVVVGCTTAGEISKKGVSDNGLVLSAVHFDKVKVKAAKVHCKTMQDSRAAGEELGRQLAGSDLKLSFVLSPGTNMNGTELVNGLKLGLGPDCIITGGLAGDGGAFAKTYTFLNGVADDRQVVAIGFYGDSVRVGCGSMGGWKPFGPARQVTRIDGNVLYELDGERALDVYKRYLGPYASGLPAAGLRFPFAILNDNEDQTGLIRTILGVDEQSGSLTFAGDIPLGGLVRLMHAEPDGLIAGALGAAELSLKTHADPNGFGILVSCVGRKIVMGDDIEDEIDVVKKALGKNSVLAGFYSYGEICPFTGFTECKLHNQTMTITWLSEAA
jgi:hypothetical protein